jgi:hypothetical protein
VDAVTDRCYCREAPRNPATGQPRFRCNACWNGLVEGKNELVRENQRLRAAVAEEREACARLVDATEHAGWYRPDYPAAEFVGDVGETLERAAAAIRARGTKA